MAPDGTSALVCNGVLNGTRRDSLTDPAPMQPDEIYELTIDLDATAWRFEPGHSIRLSICSADFPNLWPTPYPGTNRVYRDPEHPSRLLLPVAPTKDPQDETSFQPGLEPGRIYQLAPDEPVWEIVHDLMGDRTGLKTLTRDVARPSATTEVTNERRLEVWASNRSPADVVATGRHLRRITRSDGIYRVDATCVLRGTETAFHVTIDLHITVNDMPHHQQRWVKTLERQLL